MTQTTDKDTKHSTFTSKPDFSGKWVLESNENMDKYLSEVGVGWVKRKLAAKVTVTSFIKHDLINNKLDISISSTVSSKTHPITYILDGKTPYKTTNSEKDSIVSITRWLDDNKTLYQITTNETKNNRSYKSKRYLINKNNYMIIELTNHKGTIMKRKFKKVLE